MTVPPGPIGNFAVLPPRPEFTPPLEGDVSAATLVGGELDGVAGGPPPDGTPTADAYVPLLASE